MPVEKFSDLIAENLQEVPAWIEPKILPKRATLIMGGLTGIGKSFFTLEMVRALTTGTRPFDCPHMTVPDQCRVLYAEQEIGRYGLWDRAKRTFARHQARTYDDRAFFISQDPEFQLDTPGGAKHVAELMRDIRPHVLILDPISHFHASEENDNSGIGRLFQVMADLKQASLRDDMSIVLTHHFKKPPNGKVMSAGYDDLSEDNFRGASKWTSAPDTVITMAKRGGNKDWWNVQMRFEKIRHGKELDDFLFRVEPENPTTQVEFKQVLGDAPKLKTPAGGKL